MDDRYFYRRRCLSRLQHGNLRRRHVSGPRGQRGGDLLLRRTTRRLPRGEGIFRAQAGIREGGNAPARCQQDSPKKHQNFIAKRDLTVALDDKEEGGLSDTLGVWGKIRPPMGMLPPPARRRRAHPAHRQGPGQGPRRRSPRSRAPTAQAAGGWALCGLQLAIVDPAAGIARFGSPISRFCRFGRNIGNRCKSRVEVDFRGWERGFNDSTRFACGLPRVRSGTC